MLRRAALLLVFLAAWSCPAIAGDELRSQVTYDEQDSGGGTAIYVVNSSPSPIVSTISLTERVNLAVSPAVPRTFTVEPRSRALACVVRPIRRDQEMAYRLNNRFRIGRTGVRPDFSYRYRVPFDQRYGTRVDQGFNGGVTHNTPDARFSLDFPLDEGTPLLAVRAGTVVDADWRFSGNGMSDYYKDKANQVTVMHDDGTMAMYGHMKTNGVRVRVGQRVTAGQLLGYSGNTGMSSGPHLHFCISAIDKLGRDVSLPFIMDGLRGSYDVSPQYTSTMFAYYRNEFGSAPAPYRPAASVEETVWPSGGPAYAEVADRAWAGYDGGDRAHRAAWGRREAAAYSW